MNKRVSPTMIGIFVVGAVVLAVVAIALLGSGQFFRTKYPFVCIFTGDINGLNVGAPVKFKGVEIGAVTRIGLTFEQQTQNVRIPVYIDIDATKVRSAGGRGEFSEENIRKAIEAGLRAQLNTQSLVTGLLFIQLDFHPDSPKVAAGEFDETQEIPTLPTALEKAQSEIKQLLARLDKIDFKGLVDGITQAAQSIQGLANSPEIKTTLTSLDQAFVSVRQLSDSLRTDLRPVTQNLNATTLAAQKTLGEFEETARKASRLIAPDSALAYQFSKTLEEVASAARSVRLLADYLERDPSALVRGRPVEGGKQ